MRYKTKVTVITGGKEYKPGTLLPADISSGDLAFLKSKKFVEPADAVPVLADETESDPENENEDFKGFDEMEPPKMKSPEEIRKIRAKKDIFSYAASMGLDLGEGCEEKSLKELQEDVINFQEEKLEEGAETNSEWE